jgi:hypothetical protein
VPVSRAIRLRGIPPEHFFHGFRSRAQLLFQPYFTRFVQHAIPARAIAQVQSDRQLLFRKIPDLFPAVMLIFFIAGLLYLLCFEHVDNLGAYTASRPETGLLIPSDYINYGLASICTLLPKRIEGDLAQLLAD